jgi:hypothetical protein
MGSVHPHLYSSYPTGIEFCPISDQLEALHPKSLLHKGPVNIIIRLSEVQF